MAGTHTVTVRASSVSEKLMTHKILPTNLWILIVHPLEHCAESGEDFVALNDLDVAPFTIPAGQTTNTFTITTIDDDRG